MNIIQELITSFSWLPLSVMIVVMIKSLLDPKFHSTSGNTKTYSPTEANLMSTFRAPSPALTQDRREEQIVSRGGRMFKFSDPPNSAVRQMPTIIQPCSPRESLLPSIMSLSVEVRLLILQHCAPIPSERQGPNSLDTFLQLLGVSKTLQQEAYIACLPHIPLALWSKRGISSYRKLLLKKPELGCLVRHLWIGMGKLDHEELSWGLDIVGATTRLRSLACGEYFFAHAVNGRLLAKTCGRVTLMAVEKGIQYKAWGITQVRLCTGVYSTREKFPDATTLCFNARRVNMKAERMKVEYEAVDRWAKTVQAFIIVERDANRSSRGMEVKSQVEERSGRQEIFSVTLPARWTEWDIWSSDVVGTGVWDICGLT